MKYSMSDKQRLHEAKLSSDWDWSSLQLCSFTLQTKKIWLVWLLSTICSQQPASLTLSNTGNGEGQRCNLARLGVTLPNPGFTQVTSFFSSSSSIFPSSYSHIGAQHGLGRVPLMPTPQRGPPPADWVRREEGAVRIITSTLEKQRCNQARLSITLQNLGFA